MRSLVATLLGAVACSPLLAACSQPNSIPAFGSASPVRPQTRTADPKKAFTFKVVAAFTGVNGLSPLDNLTADTAGNLYGTTSYGFHREGTLFTLKAAKRLETIYNFNVNLTEPGGDVVMDSRGDLFGTTMDGPGSSASYGGIYEVNSRGVETVLHAFTGGADGALPFSNLVFGPDGNLYGTASLGGSAQSQCEAGCGVVFEISPSGSYSVVHTFTQSDGSGPAAGVTFDSQGNLYGTTQFGGAAGSGTVYKIDPSGNETVLYSFKNGADGGQPISNIIFDAQGNLYGTASTGGKNKPACRVGPSIGCGVIFKLTPSGTETTLHEFGGHPDGAQPLCGLLLNSDGDLLGTTREGGATEYGGTVFAISTAGANYTVIHRFTPKEGQEPQGALYMDATGDLFGTTTIGGKGNGGTVFEMSPRTSAV
jgi:uncharacterized repeat protein (TIGR03803 family)